MKTVMIMGATTIRIGGEVFKNQEISQQVVTRMQDLASEFSQIFWGWYPRTLTAAARARGASLVPSTFQPWLHPWLS